MASGKGSEQTVEVSGSANSKRRRHVFGHRRGLGLFSPAPHGVHEEAPQLAGSSYQVFLIALADMGADLGALEFEVVLKLIDVHHTSDGDPILLKNEILFS
jgi:hypothetical protein